MTAAGTVALEAVYRLANAFIEAMERWELATLAREIQC